LLGFCSLFLRDSKNTNRRITVHEGIWEDGEKEGQGQNTLLLSEGILLPDAKLQIWYLQILNSKTA